MESLKMRKASQDDAKEIVNCVNLSYEKYVSRMGKKLEPMLLDYNQIIKEENAFVGEYEGVIVGIFVLKINGDYISLENIAVNPLYQGKGIGKALMNFAEDFTIEKGFNELRLYTNVKMEENIEIYKKQGYLIYDIKNEKVI